MDLDLIDVRTSNGIFTWNNKQSGDRGIACRLDRFLLSESVMMVGGNLRVVVLPMTGSDHWLVCLLMEIEGPHNKRPFRFEKFWLSLPDFKSKSHDGGRIRPKWKDQLCTTFNKG